MKIAITDGCANGGMMDSLSIEPLKSDTDFYIVVDVSNEEWANWKTFLAAHDSWEYFWDQKMIAAEKSKGK